MSSASCPTRAAGRRAAALALLLAACATSRPGREIAIREPTVVEGGPVDPELASKNDEELFAIGSAARQAGDDARAAAAFARLADAFPASKHARAALLEAGLAYRRLERWDLALARFRALAADHAGPDADEASFMAAEALYRLGRHAEAREALDRLAARADLDAPQVARALTQRGVVELEDGQPELAERSLTLALSRWQAAAPGERSGPYYPAKAQFYLGEIYRSRLLAVKLDPAADQAALGAELERGSQLLLFAQGHYLSAIRTGEAGWAVAACARVGELYEGFYRQLLEAPLPAGLDGDLARVYREELRRTARVLVAKAVVAYDEALTAARHTGVDSSFVPAAQQALERLRRILDEDDAG